VTRAAETFTIPAANLPWPTETYGPELVTNGTFDTDTSGWTANSTTLSVVSGKLKVENSSAAYGNTTTPITLQVGKQYVLSFDFTKTTHNAVLAFNTDSGGGSGTRKASITLSSSGSYSLIWTADTASMYVAATVNVATLGAYFELDNISVRELTRYPVSIQMNGRMTYADTGNFIGASLSRWLADGNNFIDTIVRADGNLGQVLIRQRESAVNDLVLSASGTYSPGILVPFNVASRHGMTFLNGAVDGVALTEDTTPTNLPDLSATDLNLAYDYMGTVETFRMWGLDLGDAGLEAATAPSLEPSLSLTFDSSGSSFVVDDWSA